MLKFLPGIILVQTVTLALVWFNLNSAGTDLLLRAALPAVLLSIVTALWFAAISRIQTQEAHAKLLEEHFKEREELTRTLERTRSDVMQQASAEQAKLIEQTSASREELVRQTHQDMMKAERRASRSANMKVGAAFTFVTMAGVGLLFVQFMTLGLLTITAASGALGGYLLRWKQTRRTLLLASENQINTLGVNAAPDDSSLVSNSTPRLIQSSKPIGAKSKDDSGHQKLNDSVN